MAKVYALTLRNRASIIIFTLLMVALGVIFVTVGLALLAVLAVGGGLLGAGVAAYYRLRRGRQPAGHQQFSQRSGLDPSLEVHATRPAIVEAREHRE